MRPPISTPPRSPLETLFPPVAAQDRRGTRAAFALAGTMALVDAAALAVDYAASLGRSLALGHGVLRGTFSYVRYFTIQSNLFLVALTGVTALAVARRRPMPSAGAFRALAVYMIVTGATYEALLRGTWSPRGLPFVTDLVFHDVEPALAVVFWAICAPKRNLSWRSLPRLLLFPAAYLAVTLVAGRAGAGYPYGFLDAGALGYGRVAGVAALFLALFLALGAMLTLIGRGAGVRGGRPSAAWRRSGSSRS